MHIKDCSRWAMLLATMIIMVAFALKWTGKITAESKDILACAGAVVLMWAPGFASMYLDKFLIYKGILPPPTGSKEE